MYSVLNELSEYIYMYISKNITSYSFLLAFKIVESLQCILKRTDGVKQTSRNGEPTFNLLISGGNKRSYVLYQTCS